ncbi:hypothetical protein [Raineyella sp. LH-20]|uniref:hypothetical protein n=1 Tax=Raineyella sp. LH-20 TaxID=3081204 RepID=UPI0029558FF7|nr:hypothetical protein [Raineyella sp. LH-20]WOP20120.1 hypothetical protein R0146_07540 [Raineyella sp. LH-20]
MKRHGWIPYVVALGLLWVVPAVLVWILHLTLPTVNANGQCTGIGFGCVPAPADAIVLYGMFAAPILLILGIVAIIVIGVVQHVRQRRAPGEVSPGGR